MGELREEPRLWTADEVLAEEFDFEQVKSFFPRISDAAWSGAKFNMNSCEDKWLKENYQTFRNLTRCSSGRRDNSKHRAKGEVRKNFMILLMHARAGRNIDWSTFDESNKGYARPKRSRAQEWGLSARGGVRTDVDTAELIQLEAAKCELENRELANRNLQDAVEATRGQVQSVERESVSIAADELQTKARLESDLEMIQAELAMAQSDLAEKNESLETKSRRRVELEDANKDLQTDIEAKCLSSNLADESTLELEKTNEELMKQFALLRHLQSGPDDTEGTEGEELVKLRKELDVAMKRYETAEARVHALVHHFQKLQLTLADETKVEKTEFFTISTDLSLFDTIVQERQWDKATMPVWCHNSNSICAICRESLGWCPVVNTGICKCLHHMHCFAEQISHSNKCTCNRDLSAAHKRYFGVKGDVFSGETSAPRQTSRSDENTDVESAALHQLVSNLMWEWRGFGGISAFERMGLRRDKVAELHKVRERLKKVAETLPDAYKAGLTYKEIAATKSKNLTPEVLDVFSSMTDPKKYDPQGHRVQYQKSDPEAGTITDREHYETRERIVGRNELVDLVLMRR